MGGHSGPREETIEWNEECERYFLDLLAERVQRDPNGAPTFKTADWTSMGEQIFVKFAKEFTVDKLKGKYHRLWAVHTKFTEIITKTGVTWDANTGMVFAEASVWEEFMNRDRLFKTFKNKGCKLYPLLSTVFSKSTATGAFHNPSTAAPVNSDEERQIEAEYLMGTDVGERGQHSGDKRTASASVDQSIGNRRAKKPTGKDKLDIFLDDWTSLSEARKDTEKAKQDMFRSMGTSWPC